MGRYRLSLSSPGRPYYFEFRDNKFCTRRENFETDTKKVECAIWPNFFRSKKKVLRQSVPIFLREATEKFAPDKKVFSLLAIRVSKKIFDAKSNMTNQSDPLYCDDIIGFYCRAFGRCSIIVHDRCEIDCSAEPCHSLLVFRATHWNNKVVWFWQESTVESNTRPALFSRDPSAESLSQMNAKSFATDTELAEIPDELLRQFFNCLGNHSCSNADQLLLQIREQLSSPPLDVWTQLEHFVRSVATSTIHETTVLEPYFSLIESGEKLYEGRAFDNERLKYRVSDILVMRNEFGQTMSRKIKNLVVADSFAQLFDKVGLKNILPNVESVAQGVQVYRQWVDEKRERACGVVAIEV